MVTHLVPITKRSRQGTRWCLGKQYIYTGGGEYDISNGGDQIRDKNSLLYMNYNESMWITIRREEVSKLKWSWNRKENEKGKKKKGYCENCGEWGLVSTSKFNLATLGFAGINTDLICCLAYLQLHQSSKVVDHRVQNPGVSGSLGLGSDKNCWWYISLIGPWPWDLTDLVLFCLCVCVLLLLGSSWSGRPRCGGETASWPVVCRVVVGWDTPLFCGTTGVQINGWIWSDPISSGDLREADKGEYIQVHCMDNPVGDSL